MDRYDLKLSQSERKVLDAIWNAPEKRLPTHALRTVTKLTHIGIRRVLMRMVDRSFLALSDERVSLTITFKGMQALGVTAAQKAA